MTEVERPRSEKVHFRRTVGNWLMHPWSLADAENSVFMRATLSAGFVNTKTVLVNNDGASVGIIQSQLGLFHRTFDIQDSAGKLRYVVTSAIWSGGVFKFSRGGKVAALLTKKSKGFIAEAFTSVDDFELEFLNKDLDQSYRQIFLAAALYVDMKYYNYVPLKITSVSTSATS